MMSLDADAMFMPTLRVKAAALYERTYRLASGRHRLASSQISTRISIESHYLATKKNDAYWADHHSADLALQRFALNLPAFVGYEAWRTQTPLIDVDLFAIHTMMHVATLHLYKDALGRETLHAGNSILALIRQLNDGDYEYLDPILTVRVAALCSRGLDFYAAFNRHVGQLPRGHTCA